MLLLSLYGPSGPQLVCKSLLYWLVSVLFRTCRDLHVFSRIGTQKPDDILCVGIPTYVQTKMESIASMGDRSCSFHRSMMMLSLFTCSGEKGEDPFSSRACYVGHLVLLPYT